jgi:hypothetical protein
MLSFFIGSVQQQGCERREVRLLGELVESRLSWEAGPLGCNVGESVGEDLE